MQLWYRPDESSEDYTLSTECENFMEGLEGVGNDGESLLINSMEISQ